MEDTENPRSKDDNTETPEEYLQAVTLGVRKTLNSSIYLAPYDPNWPRQFSQLADRIRKALGDKVLQLEHVGSTAVPGLSAKPIIDVLLAVLDSADEKSYVPALEGKGFMLRIREPDWYEHRLLRTTDIRGNLHVFTLGCEEIDRMLVFRDWLQKHEDDRRLYEERKHELAAKTWKYTQHYADAKSTIVEEILARALSSNPQAEA